MWLLYLEYYNLNIYISNFERIYKKLLRWRKQSYLKQRLQKSVWKECNDCSLCTDFAKGPSRLGVQRGGSFTGLGGSKRSLYLWRTYEKFQRDMSLLCGTLLIRSFSLVKQCRTKMKIFFFLSTALSDADVTTPLSRRA